MEVSHRSLGKVCEEVQEDCPKGLSSFHLGIYQSGSAPFLSSSHVITKLHPRQKQEVIET